MPETAKAVTIVEPGKMELREYQVPVSVSVSGDVLVRFTRLDWTETIFGNDLPGGTWNISGAKREDVCKRFTASGPAL